MKILLTIHHYLDPNSGAPGTVLKLGECYTALGHQVEYFAYDHIPKPLQPAAEVIFPECLAAYLLKHAHRFDVIDASSGDAWLWGSLVPSITKRHSCILITRSHGLEHSVHIEHLKEANQGKLQLSWKYPLYRGSFRLWEVATSFRCANISFFLNQEDLKYAVENLGVFPDCAYVTPNGVPDDFLDLPLEPLATGENISINIAQIGTYVPRKGIQYSVPALNTILSRYPQVTVSLLGTDCPAEQVLTDFSPDLRNRVRVIPYFKHEQLPELLKNHHIKLFTPLSEGFGKALVEAMACGLAPVTTAASGPLEIVKDGYDAIVIPTRDREAIEQALERLIGDRSFLERLRYQAHLTAQNYRWEKLAGQRVELYKKAMNKSLN